MIRSVLPMFVSAGSLAGILVGIDPAGNAYVQTGAPSQGGLTPAAMLPLRDLDFHVMRPRREDGKPHRKAHEGFAT